MHREAAGGTMHIKTTARNFGSMKNHHHQTGRHVWSLCSNKHHIALASLDALLAFIAFFQLSRIHLRNQQVGWTRQKVLHLLIGSSNSGCVIYFLCMVVATCQRWLCWFHVCGFVLMAFPKILFLAAFLLLLSFWVDLCHQANDEEEDEEISSQQALLDSSKSKAGLSNKDARWKCCSFQGIHVGSRQKFVIVIIMLNLILMISFAAIMWIGTRKNPSDSVIVARVYIDFFAASVLILGGAFGCYGFLLFSKLRRVRSEQASSEMWKVVGLAVVSISCFTSSSLIVLLTDIPLFHHWALKKINGVQALVLLILHYVLGLLTGSSVPFAFVLWVMRELPAPPTISRQVQPRTITFISYGAARMQHHQYSATATSSKNQVSRASPI
ncbi:PREDICTED: tobamovirus multiplication protein 1 isoform X1 [Theobroma cacao]|uniref:Tobamovirus multiplication protein 1 isoform X1 n=2 Tax=Theobroma cacao TaxID=3641 RepID=A0AB32VTH7_THECC|nr:PREDICTED: tobamovirus multiplication protein 1 isoform X1 [Theobroma cacao]